MGVFLKIFFGETTNARTLYDETRRAYVSETVFIFRNVLEFGPRLNMNIMNTVFCIRKVLQTIVFEQRASMLENTLEIRPMRYNVFCHDMHWMKSNQTALA